MLVASLGFTAGLSIGLFKAKLLYFGLFCLSFFLLVSVFGIFFTSFFASLPLYFGIEKIRFGLF